MSDGHQKGSVRHAAPPARRGAISVRRTIRPLIVGSLAYFVGALLLLHGLRPDVNPVARVTSEFAVGPFGFVMTSAFFVFAVALAALAVGLTKEISAPGRPSSGAVFLFIAALATGVAGVFPVDVGAPRPVTPHGWVHRIAAIIAFLSMSFAPIVLARRFRARPHWRGLARPSLWVGGVGLLGAASIQLFLLERDLAGAAQRIILVLLIGWMVAVTRLLAGADVAASDAPGG